MEEKISLDKTGSMAGAVKGTGTTIRIFPLRAPAYEIATSQVIEEHAGGDGLMLRDLFVPGKHEDKYLHAADQRAGAYSILTGIAANHSFLSGKTVEIAALVPDIPLPDYPPMPAHDSPVPMPPKIATKATS
jgi:hypothetical protein